MGEQLTIRLLGAVEIELAGKPVTGLGTRKAEALLAYLVMHKRPFSRERLADLLWDDSPQQQALANLRSLLSGMRRQIKPYLTITRQTVAFNHEADYWLDVAAFEGIGDQGLGIGQPIPDPRSLIPLYRGDFLEGFHSRDCAGFEEWVVVERERLRRLAVSALRRLVENAIATNQIEQGVAFADMLINHDPYSESARQQTMRLLARSGQRNAALVHYHQFRQLLAEELGILPLPETTALYERIKAANPQHHNLPSQPTPFVGRTAELAAIEQRLFDPHCRLLNIVGPGGMGKTRLSVQAGSQQVGRFLNGVFFVSLTAVSPTPSDDPAELLLRAITETLGFSHQGSESLQDELIDYLRQKELLLILDNFEHLMAATPMLAHILEQAPDVQLLIASRERLNLRGEWVYDLHGLPRAEPDESTPRQSEAEELFVQCARRIETNFEKTAVYPAINRICHLVRGMPLAIELAASWVRALTLAEIATEIENNLFFLTSNLRDLPERHQSMQAVFDTSWQLLRPDEQAAMARLSVFRGRFSREAAMAVADVPLSLLLALMDKSLALKRDDAFQLHPLLRQFAGDKLSEQPEWEQATRERHGRFYAQFLQQREPILLQSGQKLALAEIGIELDNVRDAWQWLIQHKRQDLLDKALAGMYLFYWADNWLHEGYVAFQNAAAIVEDETILARLLWRQAEFAAWLGQFDAAQSLYARSVTILRGSEARKELAMALEANGRLYYWQGDYATAQQKIEESLAIFREVGDALGQAQSLNSLANTLYEGSENHTAAMELLEESLRISQKSGDLFGIAKAIINQGATAQETGDLKRAQQLFQQSLTLYRDIDYQYGISAALSYLGQVTAALGDNEAAVDLIEQSLAIHRESGNRRAIVSTLEQLASIVAKSGDFGVAKRHYAEALHLAQTLQTPRLVLELLTAVSHLIHTEGHTIQAIKTVAFVLAQPDIGHALEEKANTLLAQLNASLPPAEAEDYRQQGERMQMENVIKVVTEQR